MNSTLSQEQNLQEAELALERLKEHVGQGSFQKQRQRTESLLQELKLDAATLAPIQERLQKMVSEQKEIRSESSDKIRQEVLELLAEARQLAVLPEGELAEIWEVAKTAFQSAQDKIELARTRLEMERRDLTREHQDECWTDLKSIRKELKRVRHELSQLLKETAETLYLKAEDAVQNQSLLREAREIFKDCQKQVNHLALRREQRKDYHSRFNRLWETLQERSAQHREERRQRQEEGLHKLEEALRRVESFIAGREPDLKAQQERLQDTHWHEVDRLEKQVSRDEQELTDALRRRSEIQAKIEDARNRLARMSRQAKTTEKAAEKTADPSAENVVDQPADQSADQSADQGVEKGVETPTVAQVRPQSRPQEKPSQPTSAMAAAFQAAGLTSRSDETTSEPSA